MHYMVIERFKPGAAPEIYRRLREEGRHLVDGLEYVASWVDLDFATCWQLMRTDDRALLEAVGSRTLVCEGGTLSSHPMGWAAYQADRDQRDSEATSSAKRSKAAAKKNTKGAGTKTEKAARKRAGRLAERIERAETELKAVEEELADPEAWSSPGRAERAEDRHEAAKRAVAAAYEEWEEAERAIGAEAGRA